MRSSKSFLFILLIIAIAAGVGFGQRPKTKKKKAVKPKTPVIAIKKDMPSETKNSAFSLFAEGSLGLEDGKPFIYVARDAESFAALKKIIIELAPAADVDFSKYAVVAAFLGTKPTGGYDISITGAAVNEMYTGARVKVAAINPAPDRIVTDALTSPFKAVLVPVGEERSLEIEVGPEWKNSAETYRVISGNFQFSGGFAPMTKKFDVEGRVLVWRSGDLITCAFGLSGKGDESARKLGETASGLIGKDGSINIFRLDSGGFINNPRPAVAAKGRLDGTKLSLAFTPLRSFWSDGFEGGGKLEAVKKP